MPRRTLLSSQTCLRETVTKQPDAFRPNITMPCVFAVAEPVGDAGDIVYRCRQEILRTLDGGVLQAGHLCLSATIAAHPQEWTDIASAPSAIKTPPVMNAIDPPVLSSES